MNITAHGGWTATHKHAIYGLVKAGYSQHGNTRISDGWHSATVPTDSLTPILPEMVVWEDDEEGGIVTLNRS